MTETIEGNVKDGSLRSTATKTERFLPRSAGWIEEMEKRSHRRIRDLDVLTAFQGLVANEIGCARISMMASEQETLPQWAEYRCARPIISRSSHPACTARPVHTKVHGQAIWTAVSGVAHLPA